MALSQNVGKKDADTRMLVGAVLVIISFFVGPTWLKIVLSLVGLVLLATAWFRFCLIYRLFGKNTCATK